MAKIARFKTRKPDPKKALEHWLKAQELSDRYGGPTKGMTKEQIITAIKKDRNARWDAKFAAHA